jgi:hypothetical protein
VQVLEECLTHGLELGQAGGSRQGGPDDFVGEDTPCLHGGQLKFLLRAEVSVQAALAHTDRGGQVPDRQALSTIVRTVVKYERSC